jgi:hypothetical protein
VHALHQQLSSCSLQHEGKAHISPSLPHSPPSSRAGRRFPSAPSSLGATSLVLLLQHTGTAAAGMQPATSSSRAPPHFPLLPYSSTPLPQRRGNQAAAMAPCPPPTCPMAPLPYSPIQPPAPMEATTCLPTLCVLLCLFLATACD